MTSLTVQTYVAKLTPTVTVTSGAAYTAGNSVGGKLTLAACKTSESPGLIQSVVLTFKATQTDAYRVVFFDADPTGTTITDKTAFSVASADLPKVIGVALCDEIFQTGSTSVIQAIDLALPFTVASGSNIYAAIYTTGTPTFSSTSDVSLAVRVVQF